MNKLIKMFTTMAFVCSAATTVGMASPKTTKLSYQEEGMTVTKIAQQFRSSHGYSLYVFPEYKTSREGLYDVFTMKTDPNAWFSIGKLNKNANFSALAAPVIQHLQSIGQVNRDSSHGTLTLQAINLKTHVYEEYVYERVHNQPYRFHIVHESDWESNAPFFAMFKTLQ